MNDERSDERCERTELLVDQCACTKHRGGNAVPDLDTYDPDKVVTTSRWFEARWGGHCAGCDDYFPAGAMVAFNVAGELIGRECCGDLGVA